MCCLETSNFDFFVFTFDEFFLFLLDNCLRNNGSLYVHRMYFANTARNSKNWRVLPFDGGFQI